MAARRLLLQQVPAPVPGHVRGAGLPHRRVAARGRRRAGRQHVGQPWARTRAGRSSSSSGYIIAGSPDTVRQQLEELIKKLRVGHVLLGCQIGSAPAELVNRATRLAGTHILPKLRHIFSDFEDRWWPKPLPQQPARGAGRRTARRPAREPRDERAAFADARARPRPADGRGGRGRAGSEPVLPARRGRRGVGGRAAAARPTLPRVRAGAARLRQVGGRGAGAARGSARSLPAQLRRHGGARAREAAARRRVVRRLDRGRDGGAAAEGGRQARGARARRALARRRAGDRPVRARDRGALAVPLPRHEEPAARWPCRSSPS